MTVLDACIPEYIHVDATAINTVHLINTDYCICIK